MMKTTELKKSSSLPPGPKTKWWGLNNLLAARKDYLGRMSELQSQHPDIAYLQVFNEHVANIFHPEWVREILVNQHAHLIHWERATQVFSLSMGQGVLVTNGAQWERQRRMLQPGFTPKRVAGYAGLMTAAAHEAFAKIDPLQINNLNVLQKVNIDELMTSMTLDVIMRALFGHHQVQDSRPIAHAIHVLSEFAMEQMFRLFSWPLWFPLPATMRARRGIKTLNQLIDHHISEQAKSANDPNQDVANDQSLLTMLRLARDPDNPEQGLSPQELHDQAMVTFQAGHETTATGLTWWCALMARHPDIADRIAAEVASISQGQDPTPETLQQMPWLQASLKEALRLYPPAALLFTRRATQDLSAGPWTIPKGTLIAITPYVIQRDARWFDAPEEFKPERFLPDAPMIPRGTWLPFGTGPRVCIGQHFALLEMGLIAAMLLQRFRLQWPQGRPWPKGKLGVMFKPEFPIKLNLVPLKNALA